MEKRPKTLFIDIDGTLLHHCGMGILQTQKKKPKLLPGVIKKFDEWDRRGDNIILVTGRRESERTVTEEQLHSVGIVYDYLIMGIGGGQRVLINDYKEDSKDPTALAICVERNKGIEKIEI
uniref:Polynucleotide kinase n=1 Tax=viral metagenome TaxID=1070528 RepID=A0A6H1ZLH8_9ZZZZ